jgi:uncharacterized membrane protein YfcA
MRALPFLLTSLFGWVVAHVISSFDREESKLNSWMHLANYPVGIAGASIGTWVSQNSPALYNKVFLLGIFSSGVAILMFQAARRYWMAQRRSKIENRKSKSKIQAR